MIRRKCSARAAKHEALQQRTEVMSNALKYNIIFLELIKFRGPFNKKRATFSTFTIMLRIVLKKWRFNLAWFKQLDPPPENSTGSDSE
jgi:hypothetical protein